MPVYQAQNPNLNATLAQGQAIVAQLKTEGISSNPRLYGDNYSFGGSLIPETADQDNSDLPGWSKMNADGTTLDSLGLSPDFPFYLFVWVPESGGGTGDFRNVADIVRYTGWGTMTLKQAVGVA